MKLDFPSPEFDEAVAALCHGMASDEQARALNELLRSNAAARDEYLLRVELHSRLASDPDLFAAEEHPSWTAAGSEAPRRFRPPDTGPFLPWPSVRLKAVSPLRSATALQNLAESRRRFPLVARVFQKAF